MKRQLNIWIEADPERYQLRIEDPNRRYSAHVDLEVGEEKDIIESWARFWIFDYILGEDSAHFDEKKS